MRARPAKTEEYAVCVSNAGFAASLEVRKLYAVVADEAAARDGLMRVIDESGEDYLYPAAMFERVRLPERVVRGCGWLGKVWRAVAVRRSEEHIAHSGAVF